MLLLIDYLIIKVIDELAYSIFFEIAKLWLDYLECWLKAL